MIDSECFNEQWAAKYGADIEWARDLTWACDCPTCKAWSNVVPK